jgi:S-DNA-T family DNA segregation ATPase FtsK/SpoIIIE
MASRAPAKGNAAKGNEHWRIVLKRSLLRAGQMTGAILLGLLAVFVALEVRPGPVVTLYELEPAPGIKASRVIGLPTTSRARCRHSARVAVIPGRNVIGIELPNAKRETVSYLRELLNSERSPARKPSCRSRSARTSAASRSIADLARMPHLLIAGTTGSGKSVGINAMILSLLYRMTPESAASS